MSEHAWVLENIASYLADGLEPAERERLESHVAACQPCTKALDDARDVDRTMHSLFDSVRPAPNFEDRLIRSLRAAAQPRLLRLSISRQLALGVAAVLLLGLLGVFGSDMIERGQLPFPGVAGAKSTLLAQNRTIAAAPGRYDFDSSGFASESETKIPHAAARGVDELAREVREREWASSADPGFEWRRARQDILGRRRLGSLGWSAGRCGRVLQRWIDEVSHRRNRPGWRGRAYCSRSRHGRFREGWSRHGWSRRRPRCDGT
jgi:hypothetical protein